MMTEMHNVRSNEGMNDKELSLLYARIDDLLIGREKGIFGSTDFLTPRDRKRAKRYLAACGQREGVRFFGGYDEAERCIAIFLPSYLTEGGGDELPDYAEDAFREYVDETIVLLEVIGSGYRELSHRDVLGSVLALGIERDGIGDIILLPVEESGRAQPRILIEVKASLAPFLLSDFKRIGKDAVRVRMGSFPKDFVVERKTKPIGDTVASNRLDCVIGALTNTARERAQSLIRSGMVEVEYEIEQRPDHRLSPPCVISVRGYGKFNLLSLGEVTKKGRLRLRAEQYI